MSEREIDGAAMSVRGAYQRCMAWLWDERPAWVTAAVSWWTIPLILLLWWTGIGLWYLCFGILPVPHWLRRRADRRAKIHARQYLQVLEDLGGR